MTAQTQAQPDDRRLEIARDLAAEIDRHVGAIERTTADVTSVGDVVTISKMELNNIYESLKIICCRDDEFYTDDPGSSGHRRLRRADAIADALGFVTNSGRTISETGR